MRKLSAIVALVVLLTIPVLTSAQEKADPATTPPAEDKKASAAEPKPVSLELDTYQKKRSYQMGLQWGLNVRRGGLPVDVSALASGVVHAFTDRRLLTNKELAEVQAEFAKEMKRHTTMLTARLTKMAEDNLAEGKAFLAGNKTDKDVRAMDSGLQYKVLEKGDGAFPKARDTVVVHYRGSYIDGKEFANIGDDQTFTVKLDAPGTLKGWAEGIRQMQVGGKHRLFIPPDLAFGSEIRLGSRIPPGVTVVFDIKLIEIVKPGQPEEAAEKQ